MHTLKYRAYIKPLERYAEKYETILYHRQCNMEPSWTVNISPEEYYGDEELVIEQFTGLLDRNGKEIYEGDIIQILDAPAVKGEKLVVKFDELYIDEYACTRMVGWMVQVIGGEWDSSLSDVFGRCEIIGNIHENPELLGGEE